MLELMVRGSRFFYVIGIFQLVYFHFFGSPDFFGSGDMGSGIHHGFLMLGYFVGSLFDDCFVIYVVDNSGYWHDCGYVLGWSIQAVMLIDLSKNRRDQFLIGV